MNKEGERGETQIKTEVYHSLLDEIYDIPPHHPITKIDNTENQAQPEEKETQHGEIYTARKPEIIPSLIRPLPHSYLPPQNPTLPRSTHVNWKPHTNPTQSKQTSLKVWSPHLKKIHPIGTTPPLQITIAPYTTHFAS